MALFEFTAERYEFHCLFRQRGGIYGHENPLSKEKTIFHEIQEILTRHVSTILQSRKIEDKVKVNIDFIANKSIGAVVIKGESNYHIGIYAGAIIVLENFFCRVLSCPTILTEYGDVSKEIQDYKIYNPSVTNLEKLNVQEGIIKVIPLDKDRKTTARLLTILAASFLVTHELGHILNGHIDYLRSEGILYWDESEDITNNLTDIEIIQTLEYDADCYGWNNMINAAFAIHKSGGYLGQYALSLYKNLEGLIGLITFAIYTLFRLFGTDVPSDKNLLSKKHPHPKLRKEFMSIGMISLLHLKVSLGRITEQEMHALALSVISSVIETEKAFEAVSTNGKLLSKEDIKDILVGLDIDSYQKTLSARWVNIRPLLLPYALIDLVSSEN